MVICENAAWRGWPYCSSLGPGTGGVDERGIGWTAREERHQDDQRRVHYTIYCKVNYLEIFYVWYRNRVPVYISGTWLPRWNFHGKTVPGIQL